MFHSGGSRRGPAGRGRARHPQQFKDVTATLCQALAKDLSACTLRRFFKKPGETRRRFRHALKAAQDPDDYANVA